MNQYKVLFSYIVDGKRVYEYDIATGSTTEEAVTEILAEYAGLEELRADRIWIDTGLAWEERELE